MFHELSLHTKVNSHLRNRSLPQQLFRNRQLAKNISATGLFHSRPFPQLDIPTTSHVRNQTFAELFFPKIFAQKTSKSFSAKIYFFCVQKLNRTLIYDWKHEILSFWIFQNNIYRKKGEFWNSEFSNFYKKCLKWEQRQYFGWMLSHWQGKTAIMVP